MSTSKHDELIKLYSEIPGKMLTLDLTGVCNLKCVMCVWHNGEMKSEKKQNLSFLQIRSIINQAVMNNVKYSCINLSVSGEPTLHPEFSLIINYLVDQNVGGRLFDVLSMNTNMIPLEPHKIDMFLESLLRGQAQFFVTCSLNAATRESEIKVKGRDFYDKIEANMNYLIQQKSQRKLGSRLKLDLQMLILQETESEAELFVEKWSRVFAKHELQYKVVADEFCDSNNVINLKREYNKSDQQRCDQRFHEVAERLGLKKKLIKASYEKIDSASNGVSEKVRPCHALWQTPIVRSDGKLSVCLSDISGHMDIGSLDKSSFLDIWLGKEANKFRILHSSGQAKNIAVCHHCTYYEAHSVSDQYWREFQRITEQDHVQNEKLKVAIQRFNSLPGKLLTIDISNACNLYCFYCTFTQEDVHSSKKKKFITLDEIRRIVNEFVHHGTHFDTICLSVSGEPTLNPQFNKIMEFLFEINGTSNRLFKYISINTNATFLDETKIQIITKYIKEGYGQLQLTLSINSASKESFIKTKRVDLYDKTVANCIKLLQAKSESKLEWRLNVYLLFLVNEMVLDEAEAFKIFWEYELQKLGMLYSVDYALPAKSDNSIIFKRTYSNPDLFKISQTEYDQMHENTVSKLGLSPASISEDQNKNIPVFNKVIKKCASPWLSPIIRHDGTLSFCLQDTHNSMPVGNVIENSFFELWLSNSSKRFRGRVARNEFDQWDLCQNCNYFDGVDLPAGILETYAKK